MLIFLQFFILVAFCLKSLLGQYATWNIPIQQDTSCVTTNYTDGVMINCTNLGFFTGDPIAHDQVTTMYVTMLNVGPVSGIGLGERYDYNDAWCKKTDYPASGTTWATKSITQYSNCYYNMVTMYTSSSTPYSNIKPYQPMVVGKTYKWTFKPVSGSTIKCYEINITMPYPDGTFTPLNESPNGVCSSSKSYQYGSRIMVAPYVELEGAGQSTFYVQKSLCSNISDCISCPNGNTCQICRYGYQITDCGTCTNSTNLTCPIVTPPATNTTNSTNSTGSTNSTNNSTGSTNSTDGTNSTNSTGGSNSTNSTSGTNSTNSTGSTNSTNNSTGSTNSTGDTNTTNPSNSTGGTNSTNNSTGSTNSTGGTNSTNSTGGSSSTNSTDGTNSTNSTGGGSNSTNSTGSTNSTNNSTGSTNSTNNSTGGSNSTNSTDGTNSTNSTGSTNSTNNSTGSTNSTGGSNSTNSTSGTNSTTNSTGSTNSTNNSTGGTNSTNNSTGSTNSTGGTNSTNSTGGSNTTDPTGGSKTNNTQVSPGKTDLVTAGTQPSEDYASRIIILVLVVAGITALMISLLFCKKFLKAFSRRRGLKQGRKSVKVHPSPSSVSSLYPSLDLDSRKNTPKNGGTTTSMGLIKEDESESIFDLTKRTRTPKSRFQNLNPTLEQIKEDVSVFVLN